MSDRSPKTVRCDDDLWSDLCEFAYSEEGKKRGSVPKHLENAIREYLDNGQNQRIEEKLDEVLTHVRDEQTTHTHKHGHSSSRGSETVEKARQIADRLYTNHDEVMKDVDVTRAIEDIAGADDRTVEKYKKQLRRRDLLFEHPGAQLWTTDTDQWVVWCEDYLQAHPDQHIEHDILDQYGMSGDRYDEIAEVVL